MRNVEISSEIDEPPDSLPVVPSIVEFVAASLRVDEWDLSFLLCSDARISELNEEFRGVRGPTDVLSFASEEIPDNRIEGDVAISLESVSQNALENGVDLREEFVRVVVHALLHLTGMEHEGVTLDSPEASKHPMIGLQEKIVREVNELAGERSVE